MAEYQTSSIFDTPEFKPYRGRWDARVKELSRRASYYDGSVYKKLRLNKDQGGLDYLGPMVMRRARPLYLPLARAVDVDAGIVPGRWPIEGGSEDVDRRFVSTRFTVGRRQNRPAAFEKARNTVFGWSSWDTDGVLYVHYGAQYGLTGLRIADLREQQRVIVQPVNPTTFLLLDSGEYDATPAMSINVETRLDETGKDYEYAEVITPQAIRTFKNGEPQGFDEREPEETNELGFVPFVEQHFIRTGDPLGEATYNKTIPMLDEVNHHATFLSEIIAKHAEPQWIVFGAEPGELHHDSDVVWFVMTPEGKVEALVPGVDFRGILDFIESLQSNVRAALPELAFDELREKQQIATATLELQLMELVLKIKRIRPNLDAGLVQGLRLAGRAAATMGIADVIVLDDDKLALDNERPVLPLDPETEMRLEMQALALERERALDGVEEEDEDE